MAELTGSWAVGAFTEPQDGESPISADDVRANDNAVRGGFNSHDADSGLHLQGSILGARPSAGTAGRKWFTSDTKQLFRDNGATWDEADYLNLTNGGTVAGAATFTGGLTSTAGSRTFGATTFTGTVTGAGASFSSAISAAGATFTSAITGTSATFTGLLSGSTAAFTGALAGTSAAFSSSLAAASLAVTGAGLFGPAAAGSEALQVSASGANSRILSYAAAGNPVFVGRRSNGTTASPVDVPNGAGVAQLVGETYSGGTWFAHAQIQLIVDGVFTSGQAPPSRIDFFTNAANGVPTLALSIKADQTATFAQRIIASNGFTLTGFGGGTGVVSVGAVDSGGAGFRVLRVPN